MPAVVIISNIEDRETSIEYLAAREYIIVVLLKLDILSIGNIFWIA
jgi:hypothetical protein